METLIQIDAWDPVAGGAVTLHACSHDDSAVCHAQGGTWWPTITKLPALRYDLFDGAFGAEISTPASSITIQTEPWPDFARYSFADARFRLWTADLSSGSSAWTLRFDGRVTAQPEIDAGSAAIAFAVDDRWLDAPLLATYAGTTGAEGPAGMKGQTKPLALGAPRYVPGKLIDSVNSVFQLSAYGAINGVEAALERLVRFAAPVANYATYATLVAATIAPGTWATANAVGMARFGAPTTGQVSFLVNGDQAGPDGWARKPGQLTRRIALLAGGAGKIDDASLNALDVARPYNVSIYVDDQTTARELIQQLAASVNAVAGVSWLGKLFVAPIGIGTPSLTLAADGSSLPPVTSVRQIDIAAPWKKLAIGAERAWQVHVLGDIAFTATLIDMGAYVAGTTYREGNIVQDQDSSWLYINPTPAAGNAPPTLPTTSNSFWKVFAGKGATGATGSAGTSPPLIVVASTHQTFPYDAAGVPYTQGTTITATRQNPTGSTAWRVYKADGTLVLSGNAAAIVAGGGASSSPNNDTLLISQSQFDAFIVAQGTTGLIYGAEMPGVIDKISIVKVQDGATGSTGAPGVSAKSMSLSPDTLALTATYTGITTSALPRYVTVTTLDGATPTTPTLSIATSDSTNISASVLGNTVTITAVNVDTGWIEVSATGYPPKRIALTRTRGGAPGTDATNTGEDLSISAVTGSGAESFAGAPTTATMLLKAAGGQLVLSGNGDYIADIPGSGSRGIVVKAMAYYRIAGSGSAWSTFSGPHTGSNAVSTANLDPAPGTITVGGTKTGLTNGTLYEVGVEFRRSSTTGSTAATGTMSTLLSQT